MRIPLQHALGPISEHRQRQEQIRARSGGAPRLSNRFQVSVGHQRVPVAPQPRVFDRRVGQHGVEGIRRSVEEAGGVLERREDANARVLDAQCAVLERGDLPCAEIQRHRLDPRLLRSHHRHVLTWLPVTRTDFLFVIINVTVNVVVPYLQKPGHRT